MNVILVKERMVFPLTLGERIKMVRRREDLTQQEFGKRIGIKPNSISLIESGNRNASEQVILSICREFDINDEWLRTGKGEMSVPAPTDALGALVEERHLTLRDRIVIEKFLNLKPELRDGLLDYFCDVAAALAGTEKSEDLLVQRVASIAEAESLYEKSLGFAPNMDATASNTTDGMASVGSPAAGDGKKMA